MKVGYLKSEDGLGPATRRRMIPLLQYFEMQGHSVSEGYEGADMVILAGRMDLEPVLIKKIPLFIDLTDDVELVLYPNLYFRVRRLAYRILYRTSPPMEIYAKGLRSAFLVTVGSAEQARVVSRANPSVKYLVDPVSRDEYQIEFRQRPEMSCVRIFWEGTGASAYQLLGLTSVLAEESIRTRASIAIVTDIDHPHVAKVQKAFMTRSIRADFIPWSKQAMNEIASQCHIGVAPIDVDILFNYRKPFNKILSYWALGLPVIAQGIPSYREVLSAGAGGVIADSAEDWVNHLRSFIENPLQREATARVGYERAWAEFGVESFCRKYYENIMTCLSARCKDDGGQS